VPGQKRKLPSARVLRRLLDYDPETGKLTWKERPVWMFAEGARGRQVSANVWNGRNAGKQAFTSETSDGYRAGCILYKPVLAHRVAFAVYHERWPEDEVDHISGFRTDNRIANLRNATGAQNSKNQQRRSDNASGVTGVFWNSERSKWQAQITVQTVHLHLGLFDSFDDAVAARKAAELKYGFHLNHGRKPR